MRVGFWWRWLLALRTEVTILPRMRKEGMWPKPPALKSSEGSEFRGFRV